MQSRRALHTAQAIYMHALTVRAPHLVVSLAECLQAVPPLQDKAMLAVGSLISGSGAARTAIFCYAMALHAVIFFILARWAALPAPLP